MSSSATLTEATARARTRVTTGSGRTQLQLMGAQLAAGVGNLVVSVIAARILAPGAYAEVVTFLALYLVVNVPAAALSARRAPSIRRELGRCVAACCRSRVTVGVAVALLSGPIGAATGLPAMMIVILAAALPGAAALGLARGEAYARHDVRAVASSLIAEPVARAGLGLVLMLQFGASGAALAAVVGGYAAWWICARPIGRAQASDERAGDETGAALPAVGRHVAVGVGLSFILLAVLQVVDLVFANARLEDTAAGQFGSLSTIGGGALFATATIPLVLLPDSARGDVSARRFALRIAVMTGTAITVVGWLFAEPILRLAVGDELAGAAPWLGPYLAAMAALGASRVLVATRWTAGDGAFVRRALLSVLVLQVTLLVTLGSSVGAMALCTLASAGTLAGILAFAPSTTQVAVPVPGTPLDRLIGRPPGWRPVRRWLGVRTDVWALIGLCALAAVLRAATSRGLWVDEAISVQQVRLPFPEMLADVRDRDVHPPLHHSALWLTVRIFGTSEAAVRLPSLVAGVALVPAMLWTGRVVYNRRTGWVAACFAVVAPFCVWYSQEARMYSMFMLFATLAVGAQVRAIQRGHRVDWLLYAGTTAALLWTQYFALLPILVQQAAFAIVAVRRRRDRPALRSYLRGWVISSALVAVAALPLLPIVADQLAAYGARSAGAVPGQAGAGSSALGGTISVYAVGANLVWAIWGYHADGVMVQLTALWPLLMLLVLVLLGRGRSWRTVLLGALVVVPMIALFVIGAAKRDLFELRYFSGAVPMVLLLGARLVTVVARAKRVLVVAALVATTTLGVGLVDQQLNGANPRLYDFEGALNRVNETDGGPDAVLLFEPDYLGDVIDYYAPDLDTRPLGSEVPDDASTVWILAAERVLSDEQISGRVGSVLAEIEQTRTEVSVFRRPNVRVWELR